MRAFPIFFRRNDDRADPALKHAEEEEKQGRRLKRVLKLRPKSRKHMAEAFAPEKVTREQLEISREVMQTVVAAPATAARAKELAQEDFPHFICAQCGSKVREGSARCPKCNVLFIVDSEGKALDPDEDVAATLCLEDARALVKDDVASCIHFDVDSGAIVYLKRGKGTRFELECSRCGTVMQFATSKCAICGTTFAPVDLGIVATLEGTKFELNESGDINCPACGETVKMDRGCCPSCREQILPEDDPGRDSTVRPIIRTRNVEFVHFDFESGELNYVEMWMVDSIISESQSVHLEEFGKGDIEFEWQSLSRI